MRRFQVYLDTSVFGGYFDARFREDSLRLFDAVRQGRLLALISGVVLAELEDAPQRVRDLVASLPEGSLSRQVLTREVVELRDAYLEAGILGERWSDDATHVAAATVARADAIVSWNFRHIVRLDKIKAYNRVNILQGYGFLTVLSPREVIIDEPEE